MSERMSVLSIWSPMCLLLLAVALLAVHQSIFQAEKAREEYSKPLGPFYTFDAPEHIKTRPRSSIFC